MCLVLGVKLAVTGAQLANLGPKLALRDAKLALMGAKSPVLCTMLAVPGSKSGGLDDKLGSSSVLSANNDAFRRKQQNHRYHAKENSPSGDPTQLDDTNEICEDHSTEGHCCGNGS